MFMEVTRYTPEIYPLFDKIKRDKSKPVIKHTTPSDAKKNEKERILTNCAKLPFYLNPIEKIFPTDLTIIAVTLAELFRLNAFKILDLKLKNCELEKVIKKTFKRLSEETILRLTDLILSRTTTTFEVRRMREKNYFRSF